MVLKNSLITCLAFIVSHIAFAQNSCVAPLDISAFVPVNGVYAFNVDTENQDVFVSYTAPMDGTLKLTKDNPTYLLVYDDNCTVIHEELLWFSVDYYSIQMMQGQSIVMEFDGRNNIAGREIIGARVYFQEKVVGQIPGDAIDLAEGINTMTRYLGPQYFSYPRNQTGILRIRTCNDGNPVDGTDMTLYEDQTLNTVLAEDVWCSNDPDGDLAQSLLEYNIESVGEEMILEAQAAFFWHESYEFEVEFEIVIPEIEGGSTCAESVAISEGTYQIDHDTGSGWQSEIWFSYQASAAGEVTLSSCDLTATDTKVHIFSACGSKISDNDDACEAASELSHQMTANEIIYFKWDDTNADNWVANEQKYPFSLTFEESAVEDGSSCETAFTLNELGIHSVDNINGDQWFKFTANRNGTIAITSGPPICDYGDSFLADFGQDTRVELYDACGGSILKSNDNYPGFFGRSFLTQEVVEGNVYYINWRDIFNPGAYQFDVDYMDVGHSSDNPLAITEGVQLAKINYGSYWMTYTFPANGVITVINEDGQEPREATGYARFFGDNGLWLTLPNQDEIALESYDGTETYEFNFLYEGTAGEEILIQARHWDEGTLFGNTNFELTFYENQNYLDLCEFDGELNGSGSLTVDHGLGSQKYKFTAPKDGTLIFSTVEVNAATFIRVLEECFLEELSSNYIWTGGNPLNQEYEVLQGDELFIAFENSALGINAYEIYYYQDVCGDEVDVAVEACGEYEFDDSTLIESGDYQATFSNQAGCDSLVNLSLNILPIYDMEIEESACDSYVFDDQVLTASGQYSAIFESQFECDSLVTLDLTILESDLVNEEIETCGSFEFDGTLLDESGDYEALFSNQAGCDSLVNLSLTIHPINQVAIETAACDSYTFDDNVLTSSGQYSAVFTNQFECDSLVTLDLTIFESDIVNEEIGTCGSYEFDGTLLDESGDYEALFSNQAGCDSLVNLSLTIHQSYDLLYETIECGSYTFDDVEITESGQYNASFESQYGCDSLVTLDLNIVNHNLSIELDETTLTVAQLKGSYQWYNCETGAMVLDANERSFTPLEAGDYRVEVMDQGCTQASACVNVPIVLSTKTLNPIRLYPNPTTGRVFVDRLISSGKVAIIDITEMTIGSFELNKGMNEIHISGEPGIYMIKLTSAGRTELFRVLKK